MIRSSSLKGIDLPRCSEALKATLFADDTTTYLAEDDNFEVLQEILDTWCSAAKAKFNIKKTELLPIGCPSFRERVVNTYRDEGTWNNCPRGIRVAADGEPVRILGGFFGNQISQADIWSPRLAKVADTLDRWRLSNPTLEGRKHVIQMMAGGMTQYLTDVQRMPKDVERRLVRTIRNFLWNDKTNSPVSFDHVMLPVD
ncbi:hypothetical protein C8Q76DRAFT_764615 [Earliella scabrosa]|nr:hypothetical protein C8Q76DRAFT_764615 [Earliella scabrosa]